MMLRGCRRPSDQKTNQDAVLLLAADAAGWRGCVLRRQPRNFRESTCETDFDNGTRQQTAQIDQLALAADATFAHDRFDD